MSGVEIVNGTPSTAGSPQSATVTATCPAGKVVISGGFYINSSPNGNLEPPFATHSYPSSTTTWTVKVERGSITRNPWTAQAYAICANA